VEQEKTPRERAEDLISLLVSDWRPSPRQGAWAISITVVLSILVAIGYYYGITLWDWIKLLIVPAVIAGGGWWFNQQQQTRQMKIQDQRSQDEALQAYLDQLTQLLVTEKDHELVRLRVEDGVRQVIQARSEPLLRSVDSTRRWNLILFLSVMGLLTRDRPLVNLAGADLRGVDGRGAPLQGIDLGRANLSEANLSRADLRGADLHEANLYWADLHEVNLNQAFLREADLTAASLFRTDLRESSLRGARLNWASLRGVDLRGADLQGADLVQAKGLTNEELEQQAKSLEGATMPNGQKYEEWLKDRGPQ
jgi:Pentapeptide repeats (8 copies)